MSEPDGAGAPASGALETEIALDLRGLKCPLPVLHARKALARLAPGGRLTVECTDPMAAIDIPHMVHETGNVLESHAREGEVVTFVVRRAG